MKSNSPSSISSATSSATDPLPIGEYVVHSRTGARYIVEALALPQAKSSRCRTYRAQVYGSAGHVWLHEGLSPLDLSGAITLAEQDVAHASPYVATLLEPFDMPWFENVVRHYVPEVIAPELLSDAQLNAQSKVQWETWFEQLVTGLQSLHERGVALKLVDTDVLSHVGVVRSKGANTNGVACWRGLGDLVRLRDDPDARYEDVRALASSMARTKLLEAHSHVRYTLNKAASPNARVDAASLLTSLHSTAPKRLVKASPRGDAVMSDGSQNSRHAEIGSAISKGMVRANNEDCVLAMEMGMMGMTSSAATLSVNGREQAHTSFLLAVADGMGGIAAGEVASALAIQSLAEATRAFFASSPFPSATQITAWIHLAVKDINAQVVAEGAKRGNQMGSTLAFALVVDGWAYLGHVGDSRIYHWQGQGRGTNSPTLTRLVKDHSLVQSLVDAGVLRDEDRYTHPERNLVLRSLGDPKTGISDANEPVRLQPGDWLLVCSDGLWEMARDDAIRDVLTFAPNVQIACDRLIDLANRNGGEDNIGVALARFL